MRLVRRALVVLLFCAFAFVSKSALAANKLWIAWDSNTATCQSHVTNFFNCILPNTNFNTLSLQYKYGESLTLGGAKTLTTYCAVTNWQCIINNTGFTPAPYDIVMHYYGTSWNGGTNGTYSVIVGGKSVPINTAWVQSGTNCDAQTCTGAHEAYEAATDGVSADCCNGQYNHPSCSACQASCGQFDGNGGNPPWGCYSFSCGGSTYSMELLGSASNEFSASGCTKLTLTNSCGNLHSTCTEAADGGSGCCSGLECRNFSASGQPPYNVTSCCKGIGASCGGNTECCGGINCNGGKCTCVAAGGWCINKDDCCSGSTCDMTAHKCVAPATDAGVSDAGKGGGNDSGLQFADGGSGGDFDGGIGEPPPSEGCSCRVASPTTRRWPGIALAAFGLLALRRRRTRPHAGAGN